MQRPLYSRPIVVAKLAQAIYDTLKVFLSHLMFAERRVASKESGLR